MIKKNRFLPRLNRYTDSIQLLGFYQELLRVQQAAEKNKQTMPDCFEDFGQNAIFTGRARKAQKRTNSMHSSEVLPLWSFSKNGFHYTCVVKLKRLRMTIKFTKNEKSSSKAPQNQFLTLINTQIYDGRVVVVVVMTFSCWYCCVLLNYLATEKDSAREMAGRNLETKLGRAPRSQITSDYLQWKK